MGWSYRSNRCKGAAPWRFVCALLAVALIAASCGDDGDSGQSEVDGDTADVQRGGTLTMGVYAFPTGLDPILYFGSGNTGGPELGALYDRIVEWVPETGEYRPKTAESVTPNDDFTQWEITIRPDITFGDGTPYDAEAVKFNFERQMSENLLLRGALSSITDITTTGPLSVTVTLAEPWAGFPFLLSMAFGMIASPTAIEQAGDSFQTNPVGAGAGPFEFVTFRANEVVELKRNENYWNGDVPLDGVRFVYYGGASATYEALKARDIDVAFLREAEAVSASRDEGFDGADLVFSSGELLLVNNGVEVTCKDGQPAPVCTGQPDDAKVATKTPGSDPTVRRAIAAAVDVTMIDERAFGGEGLPARSLLHESFPWDPDVAFGDTSLEDAKKLVEEAKSNGWDGRIRLLCTDSPARSAMGIAIATALESAGMTVDTTKTNVDTAQQLAEVITKKDYDLSCWGLQLSPDDGTQLQLESFLRSTSPSNRAGYKSAEMDDAISALKSASDDDAKKAAFERIAELWNQDVPSVPLAHVEERVVWSDRVHGLTTTAQSTVLLDKAWLG